MIETNVSVVRAEEVKRFTTRSNVEGFLLRRGEVLFASESGGHQSLREARESAYFRDNFHIFLGLKGLRKTPGIPPRLVGPDLNDPSGANLGFNKVGVWRPVTVEQLVAWGYDAHEILRVFTAQQEESPHV